MTFSHAHNDDHLTMIWDNHIQLDENYYLQWIVKESDIIFEVHVQSHGYVGFGLSRDGTVYGSDIFITWIDDGHIFYYVSLNLNLKSSLNFHLFFLLFPPFQFKSSHFHHSTALIMN